MKTQNHYQKIIKKYKQENIELRELLNIKEDEILELKKIVRNIRAISFWTKLKLLFNNK